MNKIDLFLQQEISKKSKYSLLRELYERKSFSNEELLYFFPNNKLKRFGLPMKRGGKKKIKIRRMLHNHKLFNIIEDFVEDILDERFKDNKFFNEFVDIKQMHICCGVDVNVKKIELDENNKIQNGYKPEWCPLKPLPEKREVSKYFGSFMNQCFTEYEKGYNG